MTDKECFICNAIIKCNKEEKNTRAIVAVCQAGHFIKSLDGDDKIKLCKRHYNDIQNIIDSDSEYSKKGHIWLSDVFEYIMEESRLLKRGS